MWNVRKMNPAPIYSGDLTKNVDHQKEVIMIGKFKQLVIAFGFAIFIAVSTFVILSGTHQQNQNLVNYIKAFRGSPSE